jgi:hypothetical protein
LGAFLVRRGRPQEALKTYRAIMASTVAGRGTVTAMVNQLQPYFTLLAAEMPRRPELAADLFEASQLLVRPGAAETLELLSRELSAGDGEAARLFRQSVSLSRDVERGRIALAQLREAGKDDSATREEVARRQAELDALSSDQAATLTALAAYPQYRAVSPQVLTLDEMRATLKSGEGYYKLAQLGDALYGLWIDAQGATGFRLGTSASEVARQVAGAMRWTCPWRAASILTSSARLISG